MIEQYTVTEFVGIHDTLKHLAAVAQQNPAPCSSVEIEQLAKPGSPPRPGRWADRRLACPPPGRLRLERCRGPPRAGRRLAIGFGLGRAAHTRPAPRA